MLIDVYLSQQYPPPLLPGLQAAAPPRRRRDRLQAGRRQGRDHRQRQSAME